MNKNVRFRFAFGAVIALVAANLAIACGGDDTTNNPTTTPDSGTDTDGSTTPDTGTPSQYGTVSGTAAYAGTKTGPLIVTVFVDKPVPGQPPAAPPVGLGSNESPTWPGSNTFSIDKVKPGQYWISSYIMVGPDHRQGPHTGDPVGISTSQITVTAGATANATINLIDVPTGGDGGGGDGGGDGGKDAADGGG